MPASRCVTCLGGEAGVVVAGSYPEPFYSLAPAPADTYYFDLDRQTKNLKGMKPICGIRLLQTIRDMLRRLHEEQSCTRTSWNHLSTIG